MEPVNRALRRIPPWSLYILVAAWVLWMFWQGLQGHLGVDPVKVLEHTYGERALQLLIAGLAVTPLRRFFGLNLMRFRRALGLTAFGLVLCHLLVWLVLDVQIVTQIVADVLKRPYITIGMLGFALMLPLAVTSNNWSIRRLGARWRVLHRLTYGVGLLAGLHYVMLAKGFQLEPLLYFAVILGLVLARVDWKACLIRSDRANARRDSLQNP
ncbi:Flavocytochrome YedZ [Tritonibacter multivorans]|uniref:Protein-methionine-sulfoxide reductase heme-binding subunit MsrQ n=1 Tax=Tritonibacter multivorans TaxID=928856 RepID=A0A0P1GCP4_9RHOB|nr:protein-methionine-sulfoxide reductase heme-binding subunit MsrQ [Tritonibacter multivorans]MDA7419817.1 protein-methionine-sulfoxide reductase heme-binding subunit MsrQ [Tritonibacter multivorans]CUH79178.1 Flavocytochrome YedZ [Tritonibacter multivorans]SFC16355.1 sulfoxide reductase heme-binding subunit YedZ [Tritonibacter multivorans]